VVVLQSPQLAQASFLHSFSHDLVLSAHQLLHPGVSHSEHCAQLLFAQSLSQVFVLSAHQLLQPASSGGDVVVSH